MQAGLKKNMNELIEPVFKIEPVKINFNNEGDLRKVVDGMVKKYSSQVVTESTLVEAKKSRADLNKIAGSLDKARRDIKKQVTAPLSQISDVLNELADKAILASGNIDREVKYFETQQEIERKTWLVDYIQEVIGTYPHLEAENLGGYPSEWSNKTAWTASGRPTEKTALAIRNTLQSLENSAKRQEDDERTIRSYASLKGVAPEPYVRILKDQQLSSADVISRIDQDYDQALKRQQAERAFKDAKKADLSSSTVTVDNETGEVINVQEKKNLLTYRLYMTSEQQGKLNEFLEQAGIEIKEFKHD